MTFFQQHSYTLVYTVVLCRSVLLEVFFLQHFYTPVPTVVSRVGMSQMTSSQQHSYTLVPTVVSRVGVSRLTFFFPATCLHADAHSGVACRNVANNIFPATLLHAGARSGVACRGVALDVFFLQHSYTLVPTVVSRVGMSQMTSSQQRSVALDGFFVPATLLHAGALSGVACRSVALHVFVQQHFYTLVPTVVSRVGMSQITRHHSGHQRVGMLQEKNVKRDTPTRDTTTGTSV